MAHYSLEDLEYSTEFFGFSILVIQQDTEKQLLAAVNSSIKKVKASLISKCKNDSQKEKLDACMQELKAIILAKAKKPLQECNNTMSKLFKLEPHVLLPEHENYRDQTLDGAKLDAEIENLEAEFKKTNMLILLAKAELKKMNDVYNLVQDMAEYKNYIEQMN